jgi:hypothetical protein
MRSGCCMSVIDRLRVGAWNLRGLEIPLLLVTAALVWRIGWPESHRSFDASAQPMASAHDNPTPSNYASITAEEGVSTPENDPGRPALAPFSRDPFVIQVAPPPAPPPAMVVAPVMAAPIVYQEPPPSLSFGGRMLTPDGRAVVLARWADGTPVTLEEGKDLGNGFRVERMTEHSVDLLNPQTQAMVQLVLPPAPRFETR